MQITRFLESNRYTDERGYIQEVVNEQKIQSVLYITGKVGAIRGQHWHKKDEHYCLVLGGRIRYEWVDDKGLKQQVVLLSGDLVYTPAKEKHQFVFETEGIFLAMATQPRSQKNYERDTVREELY